MERTLLLVDDEENIVAAMVRLLRRDGYKILQANSGKDGLALLAQNEVGVIISDLRMPEMTGVEFLSQVKELYPDTVRIVLSGYADIHSVTDAINHGAIYKFLTKPWSDELLCASVEEAFLHYELVQEKNRLARDIQVAHDQIAHINLELEKLVGPKGSRISPVKQNADVRIHAATQSFSERLLNIGHTVRNTNPTDSSTHIIHFKNGVQFRTIVGEDKE